MEWRRATSNVRIRVSGEVGLASERGDRASPAPTLGEGRPEALREAGERSGGVGKEPFPGPLADVGLPLLAKVLPPSPESLGLP
jgi:hypothetical protein